MPSKVAAVIDVSRGCPLYKRGDRLTFAPPAVSCDSGAPVCGVAVRCIWNPVDLVLRGHPASSFYHTYCGGCTEGKVWFSFVVAEWTPPVAGPRAGAGPVADTLAGIPLFSGIPIESLAKTERYWEAVAFPAGETILRKGNPGQAFYVVLDGTVEIVQRDEGGGESTLALLQRGECFGEMSLITGNPVSATARSRDAVTALRISRENFPYLLATLPALNFKLAKILAHRLAKTGAWIADELKKGVIGKFEILSPAELVQALCVNGQTGMLAVQSDDTIGSLYFENGQMYEFQIGGRDDLEAFYDFLRWDRGVFRLQPEKRGKTVRRVRTDTMGLLLEGMRRRDEKSMGTGSPLSG
jgi:CRP/FNR family cyclic AMP-dependent transcriptional regulator